MKNQQLRLIFSIACVLLSLPFSVSMQAQTTIPDSIRGNNNWVVRGVMDGNLIQTNFRNHGELSRWSDIPFGVYPRGTNNRHMDGVALYIGGAVDGVDADGAPVTVTPISQNYREFKSQSPRGEIWGWLPLPYFHNNDRIRNGQRSPIPARSDDPTSWPSFWPDRLTVTDDIGWSGSWNGLFGKGVLNADLESYYVIDDIGDKRYNFDAVSGQPSNDLGYIYYPNPADSTIGGLGLQVSVRLLQWANILAEDAMFILYRITSLGGKPHDRLYFSQFNDYGMGQEEGDEVAEFDPQQDMVFGWDLDGQGQYESGGLYPLAYTGFAFLESPANGNDGLDNDEDGIVDEKRDSGPGMLIVGQDQILAFANNNYNTTNFENFTGLQITETKAYAAGRWWTGDENMDWVGYTDLNENGSWDLGEPLNDDLGRDGLGPFDLAYTGPDEGEADGIPTEGEPNFDALDVDESDQIGLRGYSLKSRQFYQAGQNLFDDQFIWSEFISSIFPLGTQPAAELVNNIEPFLVLLSGPVNLEVNQTDFFSTSWIFGLGSNNSASREDFYKNRRIVQNIYNADYNFAQPPIMPTLTATPGDGQVILTWDTLSVSSFDRFSQSFDFEGYKLFKGTDPLLSDARTITDASGIPTFYRPIAQFDLKNGIKGLTDALEGSIKFNLGSDNGLQFYYIDKEVINGVRYYYALVAYDRGVVGQLDPQENTFNFTTSSAGEILGTSSNAKAVVPRSTSAGFKEGGSSSDLSKPTTGIGTGRVEVQLLVPEEASYSSVYEVEMQSTPLAGTLLYETSGYTIKNVTSGKTLYSGDDVSLTSAVVEGFAVTPFNKTEFVVNTSKTGWLENEGTETERFSTDPNSLESYTTNWTITITPEVLRTSGQINGAILSPNDFELRFADSLYTPPRFLLGTALRVAIPIWAFDVTTNQQRDIFVFDLNGTGAFDVGDDLLIAERVTNNSYRMYHRVSFRSTATTPVAPVNGNKVRVTMDRPFKGGDKFVFNITSGSIDSTLAQTDLDKIRVVPNPYLASSKYERQAITFGRGERRLRFSHLPAVCTIKIYNIRGELIKKIEHTSSGNDGDAFWDLTTTDRQDVAFGVYVFHVSAPGIGEKTGKFAIIK